MLKVAACDDNQRILNQIEELVEDAVRGTREKIELSQFSSGEEFCARAELDSYDIILMDIEMGGMNGIHAAKYLRKQNTHAKIIYISAYDDYLRRLFSVNTFDFIDKPIDELKFKRVFLEACSEIRSYNDVFSYTYNKEIHRVLLREIMYFCSSKHTIMIHCAAGEPIKYYEKLSEVADRLAAVDFLQLSKSFLVNLAYVEDLDSKKATLYNGEELPISRAMRDDVFKAYCKYIGKKSHR